jgi:surface antigen
MNQALLVVLKFITSGKELKIVFWTLLALILIPAMGIVAIANTPAALLQELLGGSSASASTENPAPSGIAILGDFTYPGDLYAAGNCTYWAYARRAQVSLKIPNTWGNANTWDDRAAVDGYVVDHTPAPFAVFQTDRGSLGHVGFVESVDPDGTWHISEMNVLGLYIVDHKALSPAAAVNYNFIHTKD